MLINLANSALRACQGIAEHGKRILMTDTKISRQVGVRLPNETHAALIRLAKEQRRPLGWVIRDFIEAGLAREAKAKKTKR